MTESLFSSFETVRYEGPDTQNPLAYQWYDANRVVLGKALKDHLLRFIALHEQLTQTRVDEAWLAQIESRDNLFAAVNPDYWA